MIGYLRARRLLPSTVAAAVGALLVLAAERTTVLVVFDADPVRLRLALLSPVAVVVAAVPTLVQPFGENEGVFVRELRRLRLLHLSWFAAVIGLVWLLVGSSWEDQQLAAQVVRNTALLVGLLLLASGVARDLAWLVPTFVVLASYARGVDYDLGHPRSWAVLLQPADGRSVALSCGLLALGAVVFLFRDVAERRLLERRAR